MIKQPPITVVSRPQGKASRKRNVKKSSSSGRPSSPKGKARPRRKKKKRAQLESASVDLLPCNGWGCRFDSYRFLLLSH